MDYQVIQFNFDTSDHFRLFSKFWISEKFQPERVIVFHHGLGEHCNRYLRMIEFFKEDGFSFFSYDIRGHGRSAGKRGDGESILRLVLDLEEFLYFLKKEYKIEKPFLLGHSLGGLVTSYFTIRHTNQEEIKALILSAPALHLNLNAIQYLKKMIGQILIHINKEMILKSEIEPKFISHDSTIVEEYIKDPLVHPYLSIRLGMDIIHSLKFVHKHCKKIKIPVWIGHGTNDKITSMEGSKNFFNKISSENKILKLYNGLYHEIFNEITNLPLIDLREWIQRFFE